MKRQIIPEALCAFGFSIALVVAAANAGYNGSDTGKSRGADTAMGDGTESGMEWDKGNGMAWRKDSITATVVDVMADSGMIALEGPRGRTHTLKVDEKVNLRNLKRGDRVTVTLYRAEAIEFREPTQKDREQPFVVEEKVKPPKGTNPKAGAMRQIRALMTVTEIDTRNSNVTVRGPMGRSYVLEVRDPAMFERVRRGQQFVVIFTEGIAARIEKR